MTVSPYNTSWISSVYSALRFFPTLQSDALASASVVDGKADKYVYKSPNNTTWCSHTCNCTDTVDCAENIHHLHSILSLKLAYLFKDNSCDWTPDEFRFCSPIPMCHDKAHKCYRAPITSFLQGEWMESNKQLILLVMSHQQLVPMVPFGQDIRLTTDGPRFAPHFWCRRYTPTENPNGHTVSMLVRFELIAGTFRWIIFHPNLFFCCSDWSLQQTFIRNTIFRENLP